MPENVSSDARLCRGPTCGQQIRLLLTEAGKIAPVNATPAKLYVVNDQGQAEMRNCYTPHHATCTDLEYFRKLKGKPA